MCLVIPQKPAEFTPSYGTITVGGVGGDFSQTGVGNPFNVAAPAVCGFVWSHHRPWLADIGSLWLGSVDCRWPAIVVMLSDGAVVYRTAFVS